MGGFHALDLIVIVGIALVIFGPKTLQSIARSAGHGLNQAKDAKDKLLAEFPLEDIAKISKTVSQIPLSPQQAARKLISSALMPDEKETQSAQETTEKPSQEQK
ncbi:MAG: twin-arginine translocase TatA/TatE family subunit [Ktedonobacteraceae bacterium]